MHDYLIEKTQAIHTALHTNPAILQLLGPELATKDYANILSCYYRFINTIESRRKTSKNWAQFSLENELTYLANDLENLDVNPINIATLDSNWIQNRYQLLGALYVFHGSKAGSSIMSSTIKKYNPHFPCQFLSIKSNQQQWKILMLTINAIAENSDSGQLLTEATLDTFKMFDTHLKEMCLKNP